MAAIRTNARQRPTPDQVREAVRYPDRGNTAMASTLHERAWRVALDVLETRLPPDALVAGELSPYPQRNNTQFFRIPDLLITLGAGERDPVTDTPGRVSYRMWDEVGPPDLVMEFASPKMVSRAWGYPPPAARGWPKLRFTMDPASVGIAALAGTLRQDAFGSVGMRMAAR